MFFIRASVLGGYVMFCYGFAHHSVVSIRLFPRLNLKAGISEITLGKSAQSWTYLFYSL